MNATSPVSTADPTSLHGLSSSEAAARLRQFGPNRLVTQDRLARVRQAFAPFMDPMALMLVVASGIYFALGERRSAVVMAVALIPVVGVDVLLEARSRAALRKLAQSVAPKTRVLRGGAEVDVDTATLVPGDLLVLAEGDFLHADGVVRRAANLAVDESSLTGEADPQIKRPFDAGGGDAPPDARFFAGSTVLAGAGLGEVLETGARTRFADIARLVSETSDAQTPLQRRVGALVKKLALVAGIVAIGIFVLARLRGLSWGEALMAGVGVAMSAAPEEFPLVFTLYLSLGAWRLSRVGVLVRRLASVETLGSTTVICTDKTGTLTRGQFLLAELVPLGSSPEAELLTAAVLACENPARDPMDRAIEARAREAGVAAESLRQEWTLLRDHDFDPVGKHMTHVWRRVRGSESRVVAKGAIEGILEHVTIAAAERAEADAAHRRLAERGFRVLAVAAKIVPADPAGRRDEDERGLRLLGLLGFRDPLRPEVPAAVRACRQAGIAIKVVTGDHPDTARAIAVEAGLDHGRSVVTGDQLARASREAQADLIAKAHVLSRIAPNQKHLIVETLEQQGHVVAMTGDGINDAPALKRADIGVSMGQRGTEVARAAADLVLLNDDFASIVAAIREGRKIFCDVQRAFLYLLGFHVPIVGLALLPPLLGLPLLLLPVHFVWLELIVHPVSALLFQGDPAPPELMLQPPRDPRAPMLPKRDMVRSAAAGTLLTAGVLLLYVGTLRGGAAHARAVALAALVLGYQLLALVERAGAGWTWRSLLPRSLVFWAVWCGGTISLLVLMLVPATATILDIARLGPSGWLLGAAVAVATVGWRLVRRDAKKDHFARARE